jgi:hypothetical protein
MKLKNTWYAGKLRLHEPRLALFWSKNWVVYWVIHYWVNWRPIMWFSNSKLLKNHSYVWISHPRKSLVKLYRLPSLSSDRPPLTKFQRSQILKNDSWIWVSHPQETSLNESSCVKSFDWLNSRPWEIWLGDLPVSKISDQVLCNSWPLTLPQTNYFLFFSYHPPFSRGNQKNIFLPSDYHSYTTLT